MSLWKILAQQYYSLLSLGYSSVILLLSSGLFRLTGFYDKATKIPNETLHPIGKKTHKQNPDAILPLRMLLTFFLGIVVLIHLKRIVLMKNVMFDIHSDLISFFDIILIELLLPLQKWWINTKIHMLTCTLILTWYYSYEYYPQLCGNYRKLKRIIV